ncbi:hypothetical protein [Mesorhizobium sp. 113-3-9]|uniref:hypothetical protein n=1 Tax=Mesorhizobium sp. 113-3-9 TaxID=2744517 RepID=UPI001928DA28|nr:hypothetical protein [Mesorhizobium sp. 113-3-9]
MSSTDPKVDVFVFSSDSITNIWAGYGARTWAVRAGDSAGTKAKITKSSRFVPGSFGLLYCKPWKAFTVPFVSTTAPDTQRVEKEIWHDDWILPFAFAPLSSPKDSLIGNDLYDLLEGVGSNYSNYLSVQGNFDFQPSSILRKDWELIIRKLSPNA